MKATFCSIISFFVFYFFIGCASNIVSSNEGINQTQGEVTVSAFIDFRPKQPTRYDDGLTPEERKQLFNFRKGRVDTVKILVFKTDSIPPIYDLYFPVENGICDIEFKVDSGDYYLNMVAFSHKGDTRLLEFNAAPRFNTGDSLEVTVNVLMKQIDGMQGTMVINNPVGNYVEGLEYEIVQVKNNVVIRHTYDKAIYGNGNLIWKNVGFKQAKVKDFIFYVVGVDSSKMKADFNIMDIVDDENVHIYPQYANVDVNINIGFDDERQPEIKERFPDHEDTVSISIMNNNQISIKFTKNVMPRNNFLFEIRDEHGINVINYTQNAGGGWNGFWNEEDEETVTFILFNPNLQNRKFYLPPNKHYRVHLSGVIDKFGNAIPEYRWSFFTGKDSIPPSIIRLVPQEGEVISSQYMQLIQAYFDEEVSIVLDSNSFILFDQGNNRVKGFIRINTSQSNMVQFVPGTTSNNEKLPPGEYTAHIKDVFDKSNNYMSSGTFWTFKVE